MGDRATIRVIHPTSPEAIHLYTHWRGSRVAEILAEGLLKAQSEGRINDYSYATRIIFDTLTKLEGGSTGFGICIGDKGQPGDVSYDTPTVQWDQADTPTVIYQNRAYSPSRFIDAFWLTQQAVES